MIEFLRDEGDVLVRVVTDHDLCIAPRFNCGNELYAKLLCEHLTGKLDNLVEDIRREAYNAGYRDGRAKRGKRTWFTRWLRRGM